MNFRFGRGQFSFSYALLKGSQDNWAQLRFDYLSSLVSPCFPPCFSPYSPCSPCFSPFSPCLLLPSLLPLLLPVTSPLATPIAPLVPIAPLSPLASPLLLLPSLLSLLLRLLLPLFLPLLLPFTFRLLSLLHFIFLVKFLFLGQYYLMFQLMSSTRLKKDTPTSLLICALNTLLAYVFFVPPTCAFFIFFHSGYTYIHLQR
jgi:hypothetical protein